MNLWCPAVPTTKQLLLAPMGNANSGASLWEHMKKCCEGCIGVGSIVSLLRLCVCQINREVFKLSLVIHRKQYCVLIDSVLGASGGCLSLFSSASKHL